MLRFVGARSGGTRSDGISAWTRWPWRRRRRRTLRRRLLALLHLNVKEIADRFVIDARHHVFKQRERFFLELDDGVFLRIAAQADALFQVVQRQQMVFPLRIDHVENDAALQPAHQVRAKLLFFFLVALLDRFGRGVGKLVVAQRSRVGARTFHIDAKLRVAFREKLRCVPLIGMLLARTECLGKLARDVFRNPEHLIALVFSFQCGPAKREEPGSPWRPARPRNWLSIRRASWRSVPRMCSPPSATTSSCSDLHCPANCSYTGFH